MMRVNFDRAALPPRLREDTAKTSAAYLSKYYVAQIVSKFKYFLSQNVTVPQKGDIRGFWILSINRSIPGNVEHQSI